MTREEAFRAVLTQGAEHWAGLRAGDSEATLRARYETPGWRQGFNLAAESARYALADSLEDVRRYRASRYPDMPDPRMIAGARVGLAVAIGRVRTLRREILILDELAAAAPVWAKPAAPRRRVARAGA
jgi:hypothetical protein